MVYRDEPQAVKMLLTELKCVVFGDFERKQ